MRPQVINKIDECTVSEESGFCKPKPKQVNLSDTGVQTDISGDFSNEFDGTGRRFMTLLVRRHSKIIMKKSSFTLAYHHILFL